MKQEKFTLQQAIAEIELFYLNRLHQERGISMSIKTPPQDSVLAWYDLALDELFITDDLSKWTVELLYVLPIHEQIHKNCMGLINDYENGYHNIAFRTLFEKMSGMRTYHNNQVGWQFIEETGEKYFVHISGLLDDVKEGNLVTYELEKGAKGMNAVRVKKI